MALPNSPSPGMSMPRSFCCRTTSITAARSCAWKACSSLASPAARARFASIRCSGRGRLPAWLVRMCVLLLLMALLLPASAAPAIQAEVVCVGVGPAAVTGGKVVCDQQRLGRTAAAISHRTLSPCWTARRPDARSGPRLGLFNQLVRAREQRRRDRQPECLGDLDVDDELDLSWLLDGEVGGLCPLQDLVHEGGNPPPLGGADQPVRH